MSSITADAAPINLSIPASIISSTFITLSWSLPELARPSDVNITNFFITWTILGASSPTGRETVPLFETASRAQGYSITGLVPNTSYTVDVLVVYSVPMLSSEPTSMIIKTLEDGMSEYTHKHVNTYRDFRKI